MISISSLNLAQLLQKECKKQRSPNLAKKILILPQLFQKTVDLLEALNNKIKIKRLSMLLYQYIFVYMTETIKAFRSTGFRIKVM